MAEKYDVHGVKYPPEDIGDILLNPFLIPMAIVDALTGWGSSESSASDEPA